MDGPERRENTVRIAERGEPGDAVRTVGGVRRTLASFYVYLYVGCL